MSHGGRMERCIPPDFSFFFSAPIVWTIVFSSGLMYLHLAEVYGLKPRCLSIVYCNFVNTLEFVCSLLVLFLLTYILAIQLAHLVCGINYTHVMIWQAMKKGTAS